MYRLDGQLVFSPTDITTFWESAFASWMDRYALEFPEAGVAKDAHDPTSDLLKTKGLEHEAEVLRCLEAEGKSVVRVFTKDNRIAAEETIRALRDGVDVIYQAHLRDMPMAGHADFLVRVEKSSELGAFSYEVWDSKLAQHVKPYYVIQLCAYAEMLQKLQGRLPEKIAIVLGDGKIEHLWTHEFHSYFARVKAAFLRFQASFDPKRRPDPEKYRSYGRWETHARELMRANDSLTQVAGIRNRHIKCLGEAGFGTMAALAASNVETVPKLTAEVFGRLRRQCRLQIASRDLPQPLFEVKDHSIYDGDKGLCMLPAASRCDLYFDMEGFPLAKDGLEYLWGAVHGKNGKPEYRDFWAHDAAGERKAFEAFIDWVYELWREDPAMHIYHYAAYETAAIKRLMGRFATREDEVDDLLRAGVFVDLYQIVKEALVVGADSYSLKAIERLYRPARGTDVKDGGTSIVVYNDWLKKKDGKTWSDSILLKSIRDYNEDDCQTMVGLVEFLRNLQAQERISAPAAATRSVRATPVATKARREELLLAERLAGMADRFPEATILAHLVSFYHREIKPSWWRFFERRRQAEESLVDDHECLFRVRSTEEANVFELALDREHKIKEGTEFEVHGEEGRKHKIESIDWRQGTITFDDDADLDDGTTLIPAVEDYGSRLRPALHRYMGKWAADPTAPCAIASFLRRDPPRLTGDTIEAVIRKPGGSIVDKVLALAKSLDNSYLVIQGPPGSGKTTTAAAVIKELVREGHRVGITSNSHEAVNGLLRKTAELLHQDKIRVQIVKVRQDVERDDFGELAIANCSSGGDVEYDRRGNPRLVGGTVFTFASKAAIGKFDYLFVDEAGQVSLANLVAMGLAAENVILMGDQMQLAQPTQGSHPGESGHSILDYRLRDYATVPDTVGVFLPTSFRMHSRVCGFISEMVYEGRLSPDPTTDMQRVLPATSTGMALAESGIVFLPVEHVGRSQSSEEEVEAIVELVAELKKRSFVDKLGKDCGLLTDEQILVVAPYNVQVSRLVEALGPAARVGTIDKFQGQEAPVVILSMCASDLESVPRGVDFLLNRNRMNVALSRAMCLAVVVGSPAIASAFVASVGAMRQVNLYCRITA